MTSACGYYEQTRAEVARFLPSRYERVLEIGCGAGRFADQLASPCEYWGVEPNEEAAGLASLRSHKVLRGTYEAVAEQLPNHYFDLVVCNDVIEHMPSHDSFLASVQKKLAPDACLVGSVPNVRYLANVWELLIGGDWRYRDEGILDRTHLRFFTRKSLRRTFLEHGFTIEELRGINSMVTSPTSLRALLRIAFVYGVQAFTFGAGGDMKFLQFAFRVRVAKGMEHADAVAS